MKKIIINLLSIIMICSIVATNTFAYDTFRYQDNPHDPVFNCLTNFKIEEDRIVEGDNTLSNGEITLKLEALASKGELNIFKWKLDTKGYLIKYVFIKAGPGGNLYEYTNGSILEGEWLETPQLKNISHITFYYCKEVKDEQPSIQLTKTADKSEIVFINEGNINITYTLTILNNGNVPLEKIKVYDPLFGTQPLNKEVIKLNPGESTKIENLVYNLPTTYPNKNIDNIARVEDQETGVWDEASLCIPIVKPSININKTIEESYCLIDDVINYHITITNEGDVDLSNVVISDPMFGDLSEFHISVLKPGEQNKYVVPVSLTHKVAPNDLPEIINKARVSAWYKNYKLTASDSANIPVLNPFIDIEKYITNTKTEFYPGDIIHYLIKVTNTGINDLINVKVSDNMFSDARFNIGNLGSGETVSIPIDYIVQESDAGNTITNIAEVEGYFDNHRVFDRDDAIAGVLEQIPEISISKTANVDKAKAGDEVIYHFRIENTGDLDLFNVIVTDTILGTRVNFDIGDLAVGEVIEFDEEYIIPEGTEFPLENIAEVKGYFNEGENDYVTDEDSYVIEENSEKLPKTGERNPIYIQLLGITLLGAGIALGVFKRRIN